MQDERPVSFVGATPASSTTEEAHEFSDSGVLTHADIATHTGQEYDLRIYAEVIRNGSPVALWEPLGEEYLAGDGEDYSLPLRFEFSRGDVLRLRAENVSENYEYHHNVQIAVDYETTMTERLSAAIGRYL